eukprot:SAG31_NODE_1781_length_7282_cov_1.770291_5_plen_212_part_00
MADPNVALVKKGETVQFERKGYFICDEAYGGSEDKPALFFYVPDGRQSDAEKAATKAKTDAAQSKRKGTKEAKDAKAGAAAASKGGGDAGESAKPWSQDAVGNSPAPPAVATGAAAVASEKFYLTTAINYTNGPPHIGHAYEAVTSDVLSRYHRRFGRRVFFLTGTDEHGQKIADTASKGSCKPIDICDKYAELFQVRSMNIFRTRHPKAK